MARIRSVHPSLFTDEAFMALSAHARIVLIGLWCEADDQGIFEWKPLTLKARLLPVDNIDIGDLLAELVDNNTICAFEAGGRSYGAIRNFRKFQRPQKPTAIHPLPEDIAFFVGLSDNPPSSSSPVSVTDPPRNSPKSATATTPIPDQSDSPTGKSVPMEDGGGEKDEGGEISAASESDAVRDPPKHDLDRTEAALRKAAGLESSPDPGLLDLSPILGLLDRGYDLDQHILPAVRRTAGKAKRAIRSWKFFVPAIVEAHAERQAVANGAPTPKPNGADPPKRRRPEDLTPEEWDRRVFLFKETQVWRHQDYGPRPDDPDCKAPIEILVRHGYREQAG